MQTSHTIMKLCFILALVALGQAQGNENQLGNNIQIVNAELYSTHLNIEIMILYNWYETKVLDMSGFEIHFTAELIKKRDFEVTSISADQLQIKTSTGFTTTLHNVEIKKWVRVGDINDVPKLTNIYKLDEYDYGVILNGYKDYVQRVSINNWNRGIRVSVQQFYPAGDDARNFIKKSVVFTYMTDDPESQTGRFRHWYVNDQFQQPSSNGTPGVRLYIRRK